MNKLVEMTINSYSNNRSKRKILKFANSASLMIINPLSLITTEPRRLTDLSCFHRKDPKDYGNIVLDSVSMTFREINGNLDLWKENMLRF